MKDKKALSKLAALHDYVEQLQIERDQLREFKRKILCDTEEFAPTQIWTLERGIMKDGWGGVICYNEDITFVTEKDFNAVVTEFARRIYLDEER